MNLLRTIIWMKVNVLYPEVLKQPASTGSVLWGMQRVYNLTWSKQFVESYMRLHRAQFNLETGVYTPLEVSVAIYYVQVLSKTHVTLSKATVPVVLFKVYEQYVEKMRQLHFTQWPHDHTKRILCKFMFLNKRLPVEVTRLPRFTISCRWNMLTLLVFRLDGKI